MKVQVIRSNRKTIGLEVRADESVILRAPAVDEISDVEWKSILREFTERVNHFCKVMDVTVGRILAGSREILQDISGMQEKIEGL